MSQKQQVVVEDDEDVEEEEQVEETEGVRQVQRDPENVSGELTKRLIQRQEGDGVKGKDETFIDREQIDIEHEWSMSSTRFRLSDVPADKYSKFKKYKRWNDGFFNDKKGSHNYMTEKLKDGEFFAEKMNFSSKEREELLEKIRTTDFNSFGPHSFEKITLTFCVMIKDDLSPHDENFQDFMEVNDMSKRQFERISDLIDDRGLMDD